MQTPQDYPLSPKGVDDLVILQNQIAQAAVADPAGGREQRTFLS